MKTWGEVIGFQLVWLACVLGAARGDGWIGVVCASGFTLAVCAVRARGARALAAACLAGVVGSTADALASARGWVAYEGAPVAGVWAPAWIVALWIAFSVTLRSSMRWLSRRPWLSVPFAAIGAPLSYFGAERLGAVEIGAARWTSLGAMGVSWVVALHAALWTELRASAAPGP